MSSGSPITLSGYNSGLPVDDMITKLMAVERQPINLLQDKITKLKSQQTAFNNVQTKVADLLAAVEKLTKRDLLTNKSIFDGMTATSSSESIATATVTSSASPQTLNIEVKSLPSATRAASLAGVGRYDTGSALSDLGITDGAFKVYANGTAYDVNVPAGGTIGDVLTNLTATVPGITGASIVDGKIKLDYAPGTTLNFGSGGDSSNFLAKTFLNTGVNDAVSGTFTASQRATTINLNADLSDNSAARLATAVTAGSTFTLNSVSFDTTGKSLKSVIDEINNSSANVVASFNIGSNSLELKSKVTGSTLISMSDTGGNFLQAMNLVNGSDTTASQVAGKNTEFVLNGVTMYSTSTTVDESVTGLSGVTLNLKQAQPGTTMTVTVAKDTTSLTTAVKDFVTKYNAVISSIDTQTNALNGGILAKESGLKALRNQLRTLVSNAATGMTGAYTSLSMIGIGTVTSSGTATATLVLDESKLTAALTADPQAVVKLFAGNELTGALDGTAKDDNVDGILTQMQRMLDDSDYTYNGVSGYGALYAGTDETNQGLFSSWQAMAAKRLKALNDAISKGEDRLARKEKSLRAQFTAMDTAIGQSQAQGTAIGNLAAQLSAK